MGINLAAAKFLLYARQSGVSFDRTLTLGRQNTAFKPAELDAVLRHLPMFPKVDMSAMLEASPYIDPFLRWLGAQQVDAIDYSDYEGANIIHDLNQPVPAELHHRYDLVIDGGTLEHIFNFPTSIKNCMSLVKPGGHLILLTPANNFFGHGLYQFSPELFYRVFTTDNGYQMKRVVAVEAVRNGRWFNVSDSLITKQRVELINHQPTELFVLAQRTTVQEMFTSPPLEANYQSAWTKPRAQRQPPAPNKIMALLRQRVPAAAVLISGARDRIRAARRHRRIIRRRSFGNTTCYQPIDPITLIRQQHAMPKTGAASQP
jgi:SAM-dependent methyltransferase